MGSSITHLLWLDLETNGHDPKGMPKTASDGAILEIGVVATLADKALTPMWDMSRLIHDCSVAVWDMPKVVDAMHIKNGLKADWIAARDGKGNYSNDSVEIERDLLKAMTKTVPDNAKWAIAGSGVAHFDMRFLRVFMPNLVKKCAYYQYDVGPLRRFLALAGRADLIPEAGDSSTKTHRAIDDARQHAREARAYMEMFGNI
jgi:oligoribonuclease (3'-5' exoribonuclease)